MARFLVAFLLLLAGLPHLALAATGLPPRPVPFRFVTDKAKLLKPAEAQKLERGLRKYADRTGNQLVVVTVPNLGGRDVADYGRQLGTSWKVGQRGKSNGLVVLLSAREHKLTIQPGAGLRAVITPDIIARAISEDMTPRFKRGSYGAGLRAGLNTLMVAADPSQPLPPPPATEPRVSTTPASLAASSSASSNSMSLSTFAVVMGILATIALALYGVVKLIKSAFGGSNPTTGAASQPGTYSPSAPGSSRYTHSYSRGRHSNLGGMLAAGAVGAAGSAYLASRDEEEKTKLDYFADDTPSSSSAPDYFSPDDSAPSSSSYDDNSSADTGGGGFDSSDSNSGSW